VRRAQVICCTVAAASFNVSPAVVTDRRRSYHPARHFARAAYYIVTGESTTRTGAAFNVDHTCILNSIRIAEKDGERLQQIVDLAREELAIDGPKRATTWQRIRELEQRVARLEQLLSERTAAPLKAVG